MLEQKDIEQAKRLFREWDNKHIWTKPAPEFVEHCRKKARDSLSLAVYLI